MITKRFQIAANAETPERSESVQVNGIGQYLVATNKISAGALARAEQLCEEAGESLTAVLSRLGFIAERELTEALATWLKLPIAALTDYPSAAVFADRFSATFLRECRMIPLEDRADGLAVAFVDPLESYALDAARFAAKKPILRYLAYPADFEAAYDRLYGGGKSQIAAIIEGSIAPRAQVASRDDVERLRDGASEAPVIRLVSLLITRAVETRASDIHVEPMEGELRVRYRIDGVLHEVEAPPEHLSSALISRIKIMARLNIAERRLPQDGRMKFAVRGRDIDFRVSTTPTAHGESVVLRVLDRSSLKLDFETLGMDKEDIDALRHTLAQPHGILLVTGPTGSGKTTTLYAALCELNSPEKKILTIEDPIEFLIRGVNQVQVKAQIGHSFANALRSFLRQDPDIMMVGEIRDLETAQIAIQSALTGHLILSTLHTNDAASAVTRLLDMGVEEFLVASTVNAIVAQRLVRTLCPNCRTPYRASAALFERLHMAPIAGPSSTELWRASGCDHCNGTGYLGRSAIIEIMPMSEELRELALARASASAIQAAAVKRGMRTLYEHGLSKALRGVTSVEEVIRVARFN